MNSSTNFLNNIVILEKKLSSNTEKMSALLKDLREWSPSLPSNASPDRIKIALREFIDNGFTDLSHARLLCSGCIQSLGEGEKKYRLIEDPNRFIELLEYVGGYFKQTRPFRRCYRRLLNAYFLYDPQSAIFKTDVERNIKKLRHFLSGHLVNIKTQDFNPDWIVVLSDHNNLLTEDPCSRYGLEALKGDRTTFNDICKRLDIIDTSWLVGQLVLSACDAAVDQHDNKFKDYINPLITLLKEHPLYLNIGLGKLLNRYEASKDQSIDIDLREFAVSFWGNPWLPETKENWQFCNNAAREMVASWLKRHLLREFFSILSEDGVANTRRVDFWELYCEDPQGMFFALGPAAYYKRNERFNAFIKEGEGLCRRLDGGKSENEHAFIMQFSNIDVIEFSLKGNSTYFYTSKHGDRPYNFKSSRIEVGSLSRGGLGLKSGGDSFIKRSRHADTGKNLSKKWEQEFAEFMGSTSSSIREFCRAYKCDYIPASRSGSYEWIMQTKSTFWGEYQFAVLMGWKFVWSADKNGWYREGS